MDIKARNRKLLIVIGVLAFLNLALLLYNPDTQNLNFDPTLFSVADTTLIDRITITRQEQKIVMDRATGFRIDGQQPSDPGMRRLLFAVLNRVRASKEIPLESSEMVMGVTRQGWPEVQVELGDGSKMNFHVFGNSNMTRTFFATDKTSYEMEIPGYRDFVGGIFQLDRDQWRDRLVINSNWRSIQRIDLDYSSPEEKRVTITFDDRFFLVEGVIRIDSNAVVDFLNQFEYLQANERLSPGKRPEFDSLFSEKPELTITIEDIKHQDPLTLMIFPLDKGSNLRLVSDPNGEMVIFEERRINQLFKKNQDFAFSED